MPNRKKTAPELALEDKRGSQTTNLIKNLHPIEEINDEKQEKSDSDSIESPINTQQCEAEEPIDEDRINSLGLKNKRSSDLIYNKTINPYKAQSKRPDKDQKNSARSAKSKTQAFQSPTKTMQLQEESKDVEVFSEGRKRLSEISQDVYIGVIPDDLEIVRRLDDDSSDSLSSQSSDDKQRSHQSSNLKNKTPLLGVGPLDDIASQDSGFSQMKKNASLDSREPKEWNGRERR